MAVSVSGEGTAPKFHEVLFRPVRTAQNMDVWGLRIKGATS